MSPIFENLGDENRLVKFLRIELQLENPSILGPHYDQYRPTYDLDFLQRTSLVDR